MLYDPVAGQWYATGKIQKPRQSFTATLLANGKVLIAGGYSELDPQNAFLNSAELYDPVTQVWTPTGNLNIGRYGHTATLLPNGKVLVVGGGGNNGFQFTAELYDPATGTWSLTGGLFYERFGHTATLLQDGKVLVAGGLINDSLGTSLDSVEIFDPALGQWNAVGRLNLARRYHSATLLPNGKVLIAGGFNKSSNCPNFNCILNSAEVYNPSTFVWTTTDNLNVARSGHLATLLSSGKVLVAGGTDGTNELNSVELFDSTVTCSTITVNPATLPLATPGAAYSQTFSQTGGSGTIVWSISAGALPNGLTLNAASGVLSGTPTTI